jgi:hypothetical protein
MENENLRRVDEASCHGKAVNITYFVCVCVCVCMCERERERARTQTWVCACVGVVALARASARQRVTLLIQQATPRHIVICYVSGPTIFFDIIS